LGRQLKWRAPAVLAAEAAAGALFVFLWVTPAYASNQYVILGAGSRPCGSWLRLRSDALPDSAVLQSWVLGYVTSVNANLLSVDQDVTRGSSPEALFTWIDNYCAAHPLDTLARAASAMLDSLLVKNKAK
jgi:hypothetical protein